MLNTNKTRNKRRTDRPAALGGRCGCPWRPGGLFRGQGSASPPGHGLRLQDVSGLCLARPQPRVQCGGGDPCPVLSHFCQMLPSANAAQGASIRKDPMWGSVISSLNATATPPAPPTVCKGGTHKDKETQCPLNCCVAENNTPSMNISTQNQLVEVSRQVPWWLWPFAHKVSPRPVRQG